MVHSIRSVRRTLTLRSAALGLRFASGVVRVSVSAIGVGVMSLQVRRDDTRDSTAAPLFVTFGDELSMTSFAAMLDDLRYFASDARIAALRAAPPERFELVFVDRSGFGRWMLAPASEAAFVRAMRPVLVP